MSNKAELKPYRTTAKVVGVVYIAGFVVGIGGMMLVQSVLGLSNPLATLYANRMTVALGAVLWLLAVAGDAAHGVLMYPILKQVSERLAVGYLAARIMDAVFVTLMLLFMLLQIPLGSAYLNAVASDAAYLQTLSTLLAQGQLYAYEIAMVTLGVSGLTLCYTLYRAKLVPRWLSVWGLAGYAIILGGMLSALMGSGLGDLSSIPGGLWEMFIGVWLIVKGFNAPVIAANSAKTDMTGNKVSLSAA